MEAYRLPRREHQNLVIERLAGWAPESEAAEAALR